MALSMSRKVKVNPGVIAPVVSENIQNCLLLSNQDKFTNHTIKEFSNANGVAKEFGTDSKEASFAKAYFAGYIGSTKNPEKLLIGENYSIQPRPASITSSFFTPEEKPYEELKQIGKTEFSPSIVISKTFSINDENRIFNLLKNIEISDAIGSSISSIIEDSKENIKEELKKIGKDGYNLGDFNLVFVVKNGDIYERVTVKVNGIDLSSIATLEEALTIIMNKLNEEITNNAKLGEDYFIDLILEENEEENNTVITLKTTNTGEKYDLVQVFSTIPVTAEHITNIADCLHLSDSFNPVKIHGSDEANVDFSITFSKKDQNEEVKATAVNLDFSTYESLQSQLDYLKEQINTIINGEGKLGANFNVTIEKNTGDNSNLNFIVKTVGTGEDYNIVDITSSGTNENVASILGFTSAEAIYYPGYTKMFGDFSIIFRTEENEIIATASNLDFSEFSNLDKQLEYLTTKINDVIKTTESLGAEYSVLIKKNELENNRYNISISTIYSGRKYKIIGVFSNIPLGGKKVDEILKLNSDAEVAPINIIGNDEFPLSSVLTKYSNDRSDWWTLAFATEANISMKQLVAQWVNDQNKGCKYVFIAQDNNELARTTNTNSNTFGYDIYTRGLKGTTVIFGDETHAGFVAGVAASIDYDKSNGTINFSGKRQNGLEITANSDIEADCLESNYYNYYGSYSSTNPKYKAFETGIVSGSDGQNWLDSLFNQIWLTNSLQIAMLNMLLDKNKIPFNNLGYTLISSACDNTINQAVYNGTIVKGVNLDVYQIAIVNESVGKDVSNDLYSYGYYLYIGDNTSADRAKRIAKNCMLFYCDGGAIQKIEFIANVLL